MSERVKTITITFMGAHRRMIEWTPEVTVEEWKAAARMVASQVPDFDDEEGEE